MWSQVIFNIFPVFVFFATKWCPTNYKMAPNKLEMVPNFVSAVLLPGYLDLGIGGFVFLAFILLLSFLLSQFRKSNSVARNIPL